MMVVREVLAVLPGEAELEDLHAGNSDRGEKLANVLGDDPQVFRDQRHVAQGRARRVEEAHARAGDPLPFHGGLRRRWHGPSGGEATKVIDADRVGEAEGLAKPLDPPREPVLLDDVPAVERVTPELPGIAERV